MKIPLLTIVALAGLASVVSGADITGKVVLKGTPKPEITIDMTPDPKCGALHSTPVTTRHYLVDKDGGLANVFVYLKSGLTPKNFPAPAEEPVIDQVGCLYEPYVTGVMVNQKFKIRNSDPTLHNVHPQPRQGENKEFNFAQPITGQVNEKSFPSPEMMVRNAAVSPDGDQVAVLSSDNQLLLFPAAGGEPKVIPTEEPLAPIRWSRDGSWILVQHLRSYAELPARISRIQVTTGRLALRSRRRRSCRSMWLRTPTT